MDSSMDKLEAMRNRSLDNYFKEQPNHYCPILSVVNRPFDPVQAFLTD